MTVARNTLALRRRSLNTRPQYASASRTQAHTTTVCMHAPRRVRRAAHELRDVRLVQSSTATTTSTTNITVTEPPESNTRDERSRTRLVAGVVGGGPGGLAVACALAKRGYDVRVYEALSQPPPPDSKEWGNPERSYQLGIGARGQNALTELGAWDAVLANCQPALGRLSFDDEGNSVATLRRDKLYTTQVLQRDRLQSALLSHVRDVHGSCVNVKFGVECTGVEARSDKRTAITLRDAEGIESTILCDLVIGADGAASAVRSYLAENGVKSRRYVDDNKLVYKTLALRNITGRFATTTKVTMPDGSTEPSDEKVRFDETNWGGRSKSGITFDALPTSDGHMICVVLFKPDDERLAKMEPTAEAARNFFKDLFPFLLPYMEDADLERFAQKSPKNLPSFSYTYPKLHHGNVALLGDAIHAVKPYFGQGVNSAFEDVVILSKALAMATARVNARTSTEAMDDVTVDTPDSVLEGLDEYSRERAKDAESLVKVSRSFDRPGKLGTFLFVFPLILDTICNKLFGPALCEKSSIAILSDMKYSYSEGAARKRRDRFVQGAIFAAILSFVLFVARGVFSFVRAAIAS
ncbi:FAD-binding domain-containing protein [Pseudoscourfieldia marina]